MKYNNLISALSMAILAVFIIGSAQAQSNNKQKKAGNAESSAKSGSPKTVNNKCCECDYLSLCGFSGTRPFDGITYKVLTNNDGSITYYNCDNGVFTMKWETVYTPDVKTATDYDPISNTETIIYFHEGQKVRLHTKVFLKCYEPKGTEWTSDGTRFYIEKKDTAITFNGVKYKQVMVVREGDSYIYYAKGIGKVTEVSNIDYQRGLKSVVFEKGIIDSTITGTWIQDKHPGYSASRYFRFNGDGTGEYGDFNQQTKVFGKPNVFKWRMIGNTFYEQQMNCEDQVCFFEFEINKIETGLSIGKIKYKRF